MPELKKKSARPVNPGKLGFACLVLIFYFVFEYDRPHMRHLLGFLGPLKIPMFLTIALMIIFLNTEKSLLRDRLVIYVCMFILLIGFSVTYAHNTYYVWGMFKTLSVILFAVILVMPVICSAPFRFYRFLNYWVLINVLLALHALKYGGHGPGGFTWDENDMALALNMCVPIPFYMLLSGQYGGMKRFLLMLGTLILVIGSGATMSRGGFLGLVAVFGMIWLLSDKKMKSLGIVLAFVLVAGYPVYKMIPDKYKSEMETISDTNDSTRESRIEFWGYGWQMFLDNPVLGVGAANFPWVVHLYQMRAPGYDPNRVTLFGGRPAHSLYFSLIPELGTVGIIIFVLILREVFTRLRRIIRMASEHPQLARTGMIAKSFLVSTIAYLVTGAFISVLYYPPFWYLVAFVLTLERVANAEYEQIANEEEHASKGDPHHRNSRTGRRGKHSRAGRPRFAG